MTLHEINIDILVSNKLGTNRDLSLKDSCRIREFKPRRRHDWHENQALYHRQTDRQTDILLTEKKSHNRLICHRDERDICTCIYKIVSLLKSYDNIHGMTYTAKIMLSGIYQFATKNNYIHENRDTQKNYFMN